MTSGAALGGEEVRREGDLLEGGKEGVLPAAELSVVLKVRAAFERARALFAPSVFLATFLLSYMKNGLELECGGV